MNRLALVTLLLGLCSNAQAQNNIGASQCKSCHEFEYRVWAASPHAKAHVSLSDLQKRDAKCNTCHLMTADENGPEPVGVECERCHGPGRYYHRRYVMRDRELSRFVGLVEQKPEQCLQCHTEGAPSIRPFDFATMWARIDHGREARLKWEKTRAAAALKAKEAAVETEDEP